MKKQVVYIVDLLGDNRFEVLLPSDARLAALLPPLLPSLGVTAPVEARLLLRRSGQLLAGDTTLRAAGVVDHDTLRLLTTPLAEGSRPVAAASSSTGRVLEQTACIPYLPASPFCFPEQHAIWGEPEQASVQVSFSQSSYAKVMAQARASRVEVGGLLLGQIYAANSRQHLWVADALPYPLAMAGHFVFSHEGWATLLAQAAQHLNMRIVGWYHSRPNGGTEFTANDQNIQRLGFGSPRVGLVIDQVRNEANFYVIQAKGEVSALPGFYERLKGGASSTVRWRNFASSLLPWSSDPVLLQSSPPGSNPGRGRTALTVHQRALAAGLASLQRLTTPPQVGGSQHELLRSALLATRLSTVEQRLAELERRLSGANESG